MPQAPLFGDLQAKRARLRRSRAGATGLLIIAVLIFLAARLFLEPSFGQRLLIAASEAAMVGGLADWFAVTALFRRPLGLPIPHTALIPANKDDIGRSLGNFVRDQFLDPALLRERLQRANRAEQIALWLDTPEAAAFFAERFVAIVPIILDSIGDTRLQRFWREVAQDSLKRINLGPALDAIIEGLLRGGQHLEIVDALAATMLRTLGSLKEPIIAKVGERTGRFFPAYFDRKIGEGIMEGAQKWLDAVRTEGSDERARVAHWIENAIDEFRRSPDFARLAAETQAALITHPAVRHSLGAIWTEIKRELAADARSPEPRLAMLAAELVRSTGRLLQQSPAMQDYLNAAIERLLVDYIAPWRIAIGDYIADVVAGWNGREISEILEAQVGRDLQFIRVNGTLVGALIGCALFLLGTALPQLVPGLP
jgi:uncharacterized membrane-anchored protein YjiN (DUF445 family)